MGEFHDLSTDEYLDNFVALVKSQRASGKRQTVEFVSAEKAEKKTRTITQNKALHKYCSNLALALNNAGYDMKRTLKADADIPWTEHSVKENLIKPVMKAMFGYESTTECDTKQYSEIYEVVNRKIATTTGVTEPWPSNEAMMRAQEK